MEVIKAIPCGYCKGVISAINIVKKTRSDNPNTPIHILGMLVHNKYVSLALKELNIISISEKNKTRLELLDEINEGIVIFSAHGVSNEVYQKAKDKRLTIVDATCVDVLKTKDIINDYLKKGYEILYIGVKNHPEAEGIINNDKHIHLITSIDDVNNLDYYEKTLITNQTTMNIKEIDDIIKALKNKYPNSILSEEICFATRSRQEAVGKLNNLDILYVVGDATSNNTRNLGKCANSTVKKVLYIETIEDLDPSELKDDYRIGVTAGASTPTSLYMQVIEYLENFDKSKELPKITNNIL